MKIPTIEEVPYNDKFEKEITYIYWADIYWDGAGADASIFWEDSKGLCHYLAIGTGETSEPVEPKVYKEISLKRKLYWELTQELIQAGVLEVEPQIFTGIIRPVDSFFEMKLKTGEKPSYFVRGGITKNKIINKVDEIRGNFIRSLNPYR